MRSATKMLMIRERSKNENEPRNERGEMRMGEDYEAENRFRDRRGREHYDNGRFAPRNEFNGGGEMRYRYEGGDEMESRRSGRGGRMEMRYNDERGKDNEEPENRRGGNARWPYIPPIYERGDSNMNRIGFALEGGERGGNMEMRNDYRMEAGYANMDEMEQRKSHKMHGGAESHPKLSHEMAEEWTKNMNNEDGSKGAHWKMEQIKQLMAQRGLQTDPIEFFAVINAMYSDYCAVAKKHGVNNMDFYVDIAMAWLNDKDAVPNKASAYYECIVK